MNDAQSLQIRQARLEQVLAAYLDAVDVGRCADPQQWIDRHPEFGPELAEFIADQAELERLISPGRLGVADNPTPRPADADTREDSAAGTNGRAAAAPASSLGETTAPAERVFGDYELLREIGAGGMGVIYEARQRSLDRLVALKLVRLPALASEEDLRRIRNEAEIAAALDHPAIVPVFEVGRRDAQHYLSMKLIRGGSLSARLGEFCDDPDRAARLVVRLAEAVDHAHRRGVLHRDLKPGNILIDEHGDPHITDFGLARRVEADSNLTQTGAVLGTPSYMAPEQAAGGAGHLTTAADVYGLGAVLYALLTGQPPFRGDSILETLRQVREQSPVPPTRLQRRLPSDLEVICLKCLAKEPQRRYRSAGDLAADLRRFLAGRPIHARPTPLVRRMVLWHRRSPLVATLSTAVVVLLLAGGITVLGALVYFEQLAGDLGRALEEKQLALAAEQQARTDADAARDAQAAQRKIAEREAASATAIADFLNDDLLGQANPLKKLGRDVPLGVVLDKAAQQLEGRFPDRPLVEASVRHTLGATYRDLGEYEQARRQFARAFDLRTRHLGDEHPDTLNSRSQLAHVYLFLERYGEMKAMHLETLQIQRRVLGDEHPDTLDTMGSLADAYRVLKECDQAEALLCEKLKIQRRRHGEDHFRTLSTLSSLGRLYWTAGRYDEAAAHLETAVAGLRRVRGHEHPATVVSQTRLAGVYKDAGRYDEADALYNDALRLQQRDLGEDHRYTKIVERAVNELRLCHVSPDGGAFRSPQTVGIASSREDLVLRYTLDGSQPTAESPVYERPLSIADTATISVVPFADGAAAGATVRARFFIDPRAVRLHTGWHVWDASGNNVHDAPSRWSVDQGQVLQSSNLWDGRPDDRSPESLRRGSLRIYGTSRNFTDGELALQIASDDDDAIGLAVRLEDPEHYYLFAMNAQLSYRILARRDGDACTVLDRHDQGYEPGRWYGVRIEFDGPRLAVYIDGRKQLEAVDEAFQQGAIALYCWGSPSARFREITLTGP